MSRARREDDGQATARMRGGQRSGGRDPETMIRRGELMSMTSGQRAERRKMKRKEMRADRDSFMFTRRETGRIQNNAFDRNLESFQHFHDV